ncbi:gephyrin-like molybdotransferase Glp [Acidovorax sp. SDU_ACID1]|uniref:molybdopterin molybdotransferase MoeA n=1 Tax=Acidovorax sp. SDU_ACID1 TaxID=3136632 RepID=UPI003872BD7D
MTTIAQIAASLPGYDPQALRADDVTAFLRQLAQPVAQAEEVALFDALGRVLAQDVVSPMSVPPHDNSAMDGYAFDGAQLQGGQPLVLRPVGATAFAGAAGAAAVAPGECVRIMTGAVMPAGLDTVVPQELATAEPDGRIRVAPGLLRRGDNRRLKGEDLLQGRVALPQGELLTPAALGLAASLGLQSVTVYRRLRVAFFSTGNEILSPGEPPREGAVYDSNRYTLFGLLARLGVQAIDLGVVRDDPALLRAALARAAREADAIITSGGAGAGDADHMHAVLQELGDVAFWRIAMRPGRPMAAGRIQAESPSRADAASAGSYGNASILFGLPGNPVAVMVTFLAFVRPALLRMMGCTRPAPPLLRAVAAEPLRKRPGRTEYQRGVVTAAADGTLQVRTTGNQGSGVLSSMVQANGLVVLHHGQGPVAAGDTVEVMMFDGAL